MFRPVVLNWRPFAPLGNLAMSGEIFSGHLDPMGRDQRPWQISYKAQISIPDTQQRAIQPLKSIIPKLRNPGHRVPLSVSEPAAMLWGSPSWPHETTWKKRPPARHQLSKQPGRSTRHLSNEAIVNVPAPENAEGIGSVSSVQMAEPWDIINWYWISH